MDKPLIPIAVLLSQEQWHTLLADRVSYMYTEIQGQVYLWGGWPLSEYSDSYSTGLKSVPLTKMSLGVYWHPSYIFSSIILSLL